MYDSTNADSDGDTFADGDEVGSVSDPLDSTSMPGVTSCSNHDDCCNVGGRNFLRTPVVYSAESSGEDYTLMGLNTVMAKFRTVPGLTAHIAIDGIGVTRIVIGEHRVVSPMRDTIHVLKMPFLLKHSVSRMVVRHLEMLGFQSTSPSSTSTVQIGWPRQVTPYSRPKTGRCSPTALSYRQSIGVSI